MTARRMFAFVALIAVPLGGCGGAVVTITHTRLEPIAFVPAVDASPVAVESNIPIKFNKENRRGPGNVTINATLGLSVAADSATSGNVLAIRPTSTLKYSTTYPVGLSPDPVEDWAGNSYAGTDRYAFTTFSQPCTPTVPVTVQLFGDSTQVAAYNYGFLQDEMNTQFGVGAVHIVLAAVSGTNSTNLVEGTDGLNARWPASVTANIAIVNHGINDQRVLTTLAQYRANLITFTNSSAVIVLETPNPLHSVAWSNPAYNSVMRDVAVATKAPIADVETYVLGLRNWQANIPDGVHPDATLHALIAKNVIAPTLKPLITKMRCK